MRSVLLDRLKVRLAYARLALPQVVAGRNLPPGQLDHDQKAFGTDQFYLLSLARIHGTIFKIWWNGKLTTCLMGLQEGSRFLQEHRGHLRAATIDMRSIFPFGFLRAMEGETHSYYRKRVQNAFRQSRTEAVSSKIAEIINRGLGAIASDPQPVARERLASVLKETSTEVVLYRIFGLSPKIATYSSIVDAYNRYAPNGMPLRLNKRRRLQYQELRSLIVAHMAENTPADGSLLAALRDEGPLDDTLIGNLIHMVEFSRFDLGGLWHWIVFEASKQRDFLQEIIEASESERRSLVVSFVSEVLRTQQSEYVYRHVNQTIQYRGFVLPKGSRVRVCVWESHRDPKQFPEPNRFDPRRFYGTQASKPAYSPFGLDHHRCLGANWTIDLSAILLESLAAGFVLEGHNYGEPYKGRFHFEPGLDSSLTLLRKTPAASAN